MSSGEQTWLTTGEEFIHLLRHRIRTPLHQIISYAEIIAEDPGLARDPDLSGCLGEILVICESVLRETCLGSSPAQLSESSPADFEKRLRNETGRVLASSLRLCALAEEKQHLQVLQDAAKILAAAKDMDEIRSAVCGPSLTTAIARSSDAMPSASPARKNGNGAVAYEVRPVKKPNQTGIVLVVDDNEANRDLLSRRLLRDGYEVMVAETGRQALRMARRYKFDLILLDIMMPEMDGFEVLAELKDDAGLREIPVIMITAVDEIESVVRCVELGADDYLMKPFNPVLLRARVGALLERKHLRDQEIKRTHELEIALTAVEQQREKVEHLLLNILPHSVAEELQAFGSVQPRYFEDVTIVFADFVGFTLSTEQLPAEELVLVLNDYFTAFDNIVRRYGLEKLKTIGDCYMFAGGLPERTPSHPIDVILSALEMLEATERLARKGPVEWKVRIGIHTGPVVAGVVGIHKFCFDIWGDAVNFGSRMESSGAPGKINISHHTYVRVKDFFSCQSRGQIRTKDGREVEMYFVNGIAARLSGNPAISPQEAFMQRYRTYFRKEPPARPPALAEGPLAT